MNSQNKVLMSLLTASISALAAAPSLAKSTETIKEDNTNIKNSEIIDIMAVTPTGLTASQQAFKQEMRAQVDVMLSKKAPIMKIYENIAIVVDNYGKGDESIKKEVFRDLNLAAAPAKQDSVLNAPPPSTAQVPSGTTNACHGICHTACHTACHGARGWR